MNFNQAQTMVRGHSKLESLVAKSWWQEAGRECLRLSKQREEAHLAPQWVALGVMFYAHTTSKEVLKERIEGEQ